MPLTTNELIDHIGRRIVIPISQGKYVNLDYRSFLDDCIITKIVPKLITIDEFYCVDRQTIPLIGSTSKYRLPNRSVCWALDEVGYVDNAGNYFKLPRTSKRHEYQSSTSTYPSGFYLEDGFIYTTPNMGATVTGSLQLGYFRRRNKMALVSACGLITNVVTAAPNYVITVDNAPSGTATGADFISGTTPYDLIADNTAITLVGVTVTVPIASFDRTPVNGDWVVQAGYTPIPQLPDEWHYILADYASRKLLIGSSDEKTISLIDDDINDSLTGIKHVMQTRVKGSPRKRVSNNPVYNLMKRR